jgi:hypothetical protein
MIDGIRAASAAETLLALARDLNLLDLIILGDSAVHLGDCSLKIYDEWGTSSRGLTYG